MTENHIYNLILLSIEQIMKLFPLKKYKHYIICFCKQRQQALFIDITISVSWQGPLWWNFLKVVVGGVRLLQGR